MTIRSIPELLAPAGTLEAARAAIANGADAVYMGVGRFNARDDGAQLTLDELEEACRLAHSRGRRIYLTLNTLVKPAELPAALELLGEAIDRGIDAAIVQDVGLVRLIQRVYPGFDVHGSTQMTVHDASGAAVMKELGITRVVLARENTLDDLRAIHEAVPELELETFVHGALCISYSGQCYMSGMISERSANRGSCAQSCRKDYTLTDSATGATLDEGYLISARDLSAADSLPDLARLGVSCLKVEGRKKKPEYVATVTRAYREVLDRVARGEEPRLDEINRGDLVQIYSRGFTGGMLGTGRAGREYITREHPDNRGVVLGTTVASDGRELVIDVSVPVEVGDGLGFEPPAAGPQPTGFTVSAVRTIRATNGVTRQAIPARTRVPVGWTVVRTSHAALLERARSSFAALSAPVQRRRTRMDAQVFGSPGTHLKVVFTAGEDEVTSRSEIQLAPANKRSMDEAQLRDQLGRLGDRPFALGAVDVTGLSPGLFIPVSELNRIRQQAIEELLLRRDWARQAMEAERAARIGQAISQGTASDVSATRAMAQDASFELSAEVYRIDDAIIAAAAGATEIVLDPFLRHPTPPLNRVRALEQTLRERGVALRLRLPTILRPEDRRLVEKWLALDVPVLAGHLGLIAEFARKGRDVAADYAVNCFNQHTAAEVFRLGARRITASIELTVDELRELVAPFEGRGFDVMLYGRPEGMTLEHCVLSAAFDRETTTCRDLCVQKHPLVELTDPAGYTFPVATDFACRNRLLHSRPVEGSEYLPRLWAAGLRGYRLIFNMPGDPVMEIVARYRDSLDALASGVTPPVERIRALVGKEFTRGHFARAV